MGLNKVANLIDKWSDNKLNGLMYEANQLEMEIIRRAKDEIKEDLSLYSEDELFKAVGTVKDLFMVYSEIRSEGKNLIENKIMLLSDVKSLRINDSKWGLTETEQFALKSKESKLRVIDLQLQVYNHLVNFNVPSAIELYCKSEGSPKIEILIEIYKYIDEYGFNSLCERKTCGNE